MATASASHASTHAPATVPRHFNAATRFVDHHVQAGRDAITALHAGDRPLSYGDVHAGVNRAGHALRALGVHMEQRVALLLLDGPEFVFAFWGAMKIGAVPVPLNTLLKPRDYEYILNDTRARVLVVSPSLLEAIDEIRPRLHFLEHIVIAGDAAPPDLAFEELTRAQSAELDPAPTTCDDVAFWLYSSGTTGTSKGVVHLHHDMVVCCESFGRHVLEIDDRDRCYSVAKLFFAYGLGNALYFPFYVGASTVLDPARPEPTHVFDVIARTRPTLFYAVPTAFAAMLQAAANGYPADLSSVRRCVSAGEPLPRPIYERWHARFGLEILDGIGTTEMCHTFIANRAGHVRPGSTGTVVPGYEVKVVDDEGRELPPGEIGSLLVHGDSAFAYYWNQHQRTNDTIHGGWVRTGDKYVRDADGYFWYSGRADDMLKAGGIWVSPAEVESTLMEHDAVLEAGVVGAADRNELVKPVAFVVLASGHTATPALEHELREFVKARLAPFKCPRSVIFVDALPKTATGKIQRFVLRQRAADAAPLARA